MIRCLRLVIGLGGGLALISGLVLMLATPHAPPGWIAFISSRPIDQEIYRMRANGTGIQRLVHIRFGHIYNLQWSPDGKWITYTVMLLDDAPRLYRMRSDGSNLRQLTTMASSIAEDVQWSPDSQWILFPMALPHSVASIYRIRVDGTDLQRLTNGPGQDRGGRWSPDGQWIAFISNRGGSDNLYRMRSDGSEQQPITSQLSRIGSLEWSPDGQWIAFSTNEQGEWYLKVYRIRPDGTAMQRIATFYHYEPNPHWSPDGQWIVFLAKSDYDEKIYRMRPDGTEQQILATTPGFYLAPRWSPDGRWIIFEEGREGSSQAIFKLRSDGTGLQPLPHNPYTHDCEAEWSPPIQREKWLWRVAGIGAALLGISLIPWRGRAQH